MSIHTYINTRVTNDPYIKFTNDQLAILRQYYHAFGPKDSHRLMAVMRSWGHRLRIHHYRVVEPVCMRPMALQSFTLARHEWFNPTLSPKLSDGLKVPYRYVLSPYGGMTELSIAIPVTGETKYNIYYPTGLIITSRCRPDEQFNKKIGVHVCFERFLKYAVAGIIEEVVK